MKEKDNYQEYFKEPDYWGGHTFEIECCPPRPPEKQKKLGNLPADMVRAYLLMNQSEREIKEFLKIGEENVVRSLNQGDHFDLSQMFDGAIIRLRTEELWRNWPGKGTEYKSQLAYGVVNHRVEIKCNPDFGFMYFHHTGRSLATIPHVLTPQFTLGEVLHYPITLLRVNNMQIVGSAKRKPVRQPSFSLSSQRI